jgi:hypothetical protein
MVGGRNHPRSGLRGWPATLEGPWMRSGGGATTPGALCGWLEEEEKKKRNPTPYTVVGRPPTVI